MGVVHDPSRSQPVHDPKMLRAIAHPVRNRILAELTASGPMRAADLARELDLPANQMSFHLRQLAKYGLVEEDPDAGRDRRDRVWRPTSDDGIAVDLSELEQQPGGQAAAAVFRRNAAGWAHLVVDAAYDPQRRDPAALRTVNESAVRLTREEAHELAAELDAVLVKWAARTRGRDDPERRTYLLLSILQPHPDLRRLDAAEGGTGAGAEAGGA
jgi:DNA-binding transcriptional ArsR family regulator